MDEDDVENFDDIDAEVPKVSVNGRFVPLHEITEDDQRQMTTEEYQVRLSPFHQLPITIN